MIARLTLTLPITTRLERIEAGIELFPLIEEEPLKLKSFQNAKSIKRALKYVQERSHEPKLTDVKPADHSHIFYTIKFQAESFIRELGGWFDYALLEDWALAQFYHDDKDRSTLKSRCRSVWHWYNDRDFTLGRVHEMSRSENAKRLNEQRKLDSKQKVLEASTSLFVKTKEGKIIVSKVAEQAGISRNTTRKYLKELGLI